MKKTMLSAVVSLLAAGVLMGGCGADAGGESESDGVAGEEVGEAQQALTCGVLNGGEMLTAGLSNTSCDNRFTLIEQSTDGNVVLYGPAGAPLWSTSTSGAGNKLVMQTDGNLVVYSSTNLTLWSSQTANNPGARLAIQDNGNLVIYSSSNQPLWQSGTHTSQTLAAGHSHSLAVKTGTVRAWGGNGLGTLGDETTTNRTSPVTVGNLMGVAAVAGGGQYSLALKSDGTLWAWGDNGFGQLGDGTTTTRSTRGQVANLAGVVATAAGSAHSLALKSDGTLWAWGRNETGQVGNGTTEASSTPVPVNLAGVVAVAAGGFHSVALKSDGTVWTWGSNGQGQLGDGTTTDRTTPVPVNLTGVVAVAGGGYHTLALTNDGTVWTWGINEYGQLGDGTTMTRTRPVPVNLTGVVDVGAGFSHSLAVMSDGTVWTWGNNEYGQLGDGTTTNRNTPVPVGTLAGVVAVAGGGYHTLALKNNGTLWAWGTNAIGQLGNGTTTDSSTPVPVTQPAEDITINAATVVRSTAARPVGVNLNYLVDDEASRPAGSPRTLSQALGDMKAGFLRFPGGEKSDNYVWTTVSSTNSALVTTSTTIPGPLTPRVADPSQWPGNGSYADATAGIFDGPNVDFDEFMTLCRANGAEPVIVVAYDQAREITGRTTGPTLAELVSSAAAWVKYANVTKGYNIRYWSIGNESWFRSGQTAGIYAAHVNQFAAAMRQVDPTIKIGAHGNNTAWFNTVIADASSAIDWLDVHDYPTYNWTTGYDVFRLGNPTLTADVDKALTSIAAAASPADQTRLTVGVTETNTIDWANEPNYTWPHVNDLGHALVTFDMIGQQLSKPKVEFTQMWNTRWIRNVSYNPGTVPNAVLNPDFERDLANWVGSGAVITTSSVYSGTKALEGNGGAYVYQDISLGAGNVRTFTAYARTSDASIWSGLGVDFLNGSGTKIDGVSAQITFTSYGKYRLPPFTTPAGTTTARVWFLVGSGATGFLDQIVLTDRVEPEVYDALAPDNSYLPTGRVTALWGQFLRDNLVQGSRSNSVIAYASRSTSDNSLSVWLLNKQTAPVEVNLTLNNYTPAASASAWRFAGSGPSDFAPTYTSLPAVPVHGNVLPIILPQTSITVLVFSP
jgi:alpha-tubulin suppressor-like RCC1 family protein